MIAALRRKLALLLTGVLSAVILCTALAALIVSERQMPGRFAEDIRIDQKAVDHPFVVTDIFLKQRVHDDGGGARIFQMQHGVDVVTERR